MNNFSRANFFFKLALGLGACLLVTLTAQVVQTSTSIATPLSASMSLSQATPTGTSLPVATPLTPSKLFATPTPIIIVIPAPTSIQPHRYEVDYTPELQSPRFVTTSTVAYLHQGDLYLHNLEKASSQAIIKGNVTHFDWSEARQQFLVIKNEKLLLLKITGALLTDLSARLATLPFQFEIPGCRLVDSKTSPPLNHIAGATWSPDGRYLIFTHDMWEKGIWCGSISWILELDSNQVRQIAVTEKDRYRLWVNNELLMVSSYQGGGHRLFDIINITNERKMASLMIEANAPTLSLDGSRLAAPLGFTALTAWDLTNGQEIFRQDYPGTRQSFTEWSTDNRFLSVVLEPNPEFFTEQAHRLVIVDMNTQQVWEPPIKYPSIWPTWLPGENQLFIIAGQANSSAFFIANPATQQLTWLGEIPDMFFSIFDWSFRGRYLALSATRIEKPGPNFYQPPHNNSNIWLWDRQAGGLPFLLYQVTASGGQTFLDWRGWSPDDAWLLFTQHLGPVGLTPGNPFSDRMTLQALHLPTGNQQQLTQWTVTDK